MRGLLLSLLKTFIISVIIGIAVTCLWYMISHKQDSTNYSHILPLIVVGALFLNGILVAMSLPALFLVTPSVRSSKVVSVLLYFAGPAIMLITILFMQGSMTDKIVYFIMNVVYIAVYTFYYFRTVKKSS
jgi:hypothetical protein